MTAILLTENQMKNVFHVVAIMLSYVLFGATTTFAATQPLSDGVEINLAIDGVNEKTERVKVKAFFDNAVKITGSGDSGKQFFITINLSKVDEQSKLASNDNARDQYNIGISVDKQETAGHKPVSIHKSKIRAFENTAFSVDGSDGSNHFGFTATIKKPVQTKNLSSQDSSSEATCPDVPVHGEISTLTPIADISKYSEDCQCVVHFCQGRRWTVCGGCIDAGCGWTCPKCR